MNLLSGLDPESLFIAFLKRYDLLDQNKIECCIFLDVRPIWRQRVCEAQTIVGFWVGGENAPKDCWKQSKHLNGFTYMIEAIYTGPDNCYFLERNLVHLQKWIYQISANKNNNFTIETKIYKIKFICRRLDVF